MAQLDPTRLAHLSNGALLVVAACAVARAEPIAWAALRSGRPREIYFAGVRLLRMSTELSLRAVRSYPAADEVALAVRERIERVRADGMNYAPADTAPWRTAWGELISAAHSITAADSGEPLPPKVKCLAAIERACAVLGGVDARLGEDGVRAVYEDAARLTEVVERGEPNALRRLLAQQPLLWPAAADSDWRTGVEDARKDREHIQEMLSDEVLSTGVNPNYFTMRLSLYLAGPPTSAPPSPTAASRSMPPRPAPPDDPVVHTKGDAGPATVEGTQRVDYSAPKSKRSSGPLKRIGSFLRGMMGAGGDPEDAAPPATAGSRKGDHSGGHVNTGFCEVKTPDEFLPQATPLRPGSRYWLGVQIGELVKGIAAGKPVVIPPESLPDQARLTVALFPFDGGLRTTPGAEQGEIELDKAGHGRVISQPLAPRDAAGPWNLAPGSPRHQRLLFPVETDPRPGPQSVRCCFYCNQVLVHSRVITVRAAGAAERRASTPAITFKTDYLLAASLSGAALRGFAEHDVSLLLNDGGDGTHQLRVFGKQGVKEDVHLTSAALETIVKGLRESLRTAAWGTPDEWDGSAPINLRYVGRQTIDMLRADLITLARAGRRCYDAVRSPVDVKLRPGNRRLEDLLVDPAYIQFASRGSVSELVPAALFYDRPLDANLHQLTLCPGFELALTQNAPLAESPCWKGGCPSSGRNDVVCPAGFWGYRHYLGVPLTVGPEGGEASAATDLGCTGEPTVSVSVSTDERFVMRQPHLDRLRELWPRLQLNDTRDKTIKSLSVGWHVSYFYCHGDFVGPRRNIPALLVGPNNSARIDASLISQSARWAAPGPLVFLNGCHTTALLPSQAFGMVAAFIQDGNAAGVIGTEITVYESLATRFGLEFLQGLLVDELELGVAVRRARLVLLKEMNPLGLVYTPFALSRLRLRPPLAAP